MSLALHWTLQSALRIPLEMLHVSLTTKPNTNTHQKLESAWCPLYSPSPIVGHHLLNTCWQIHVAPEKNHIRGEKNTPFPSWNSQLLDAAFYQEQSLHNVLRFLSLLIRNSTIGMLIYRYIMRPWRLNFFTLQHYPPPLTKSISHAVLIVPQGQTKIQVPQKDAKNNYYIFHPYTSHVGSFKHIPDTYPKPLNHQWFPCIRLCVDALRLFWVFSKGICIC